MLPSRLKKELAELEKVILNDEEPIGELEKHAEWVAELKTEAYIYRGKHFQYPENRSW